jgi:dihydroflavonol-4-reductase
MKNTTYLLTGAAGFLGSHICKQLLERNDHIKAFVLKNDPAIKYIPESVELFEGDLCNEQDCMNFFNVNTENSICIHCASMVTVNPDYSEKLIAVNIDGTDNIIKACKAHKECQKLVYVSSTGAIPELQKGKAIKEVKHFYPYDENLVVGWYSKTKAIATQHVLDAAKQGLNACVVHPSGILGPEDNAVSTTTKTIIEIIKGEMPIGMKGSFNLADVRDLAFGVIAAADKGRQGECYILANKEVTLKEMCEILDSKLHCGTCKAYLPLGLAKIIAKSSEKKAKKTGKQPIMTTFSVYNLERNNTFDYSKAQKELGYNPRPYLETLTDEANWLKESGKLA